MEQKLHIDFDFENITEDAKKTNQVYLPFSLLFPVESDVELTLCQIDPTPTKDVRRPFTVKGTTIHQLITYYLLYIDIF